MLKALKGLAVQFLNSTKENLTINHLYSGYTITGRIVLFTILAPHKSYFQTASMKFELYQ